MNPIVEQPIYDGDNENLERIVEIVDQLLELEYTGHVVVLVSVAILNEADNVRSVKTGAIKSVTNRLTTSSRERHQIENSLNALYSREFIDRKKASVGNAYNWSASAKGRELLAFSLESGVVDELAESDVTNDL